MNATDTPQTGTPDRPTTLQCGICLAVLLFIVGFIIYHAVTPHDNNTVIEKDNPSQQASK